MHGHHDRRYQAIPRPAATTIYNLDSRDRGRPRLAARSSRLANNGKFAHAIVRHSQARPPCLAPLGGRDGGRTWAVFGNHWPSRSGGQFESAGYRHIAGETLGYFHQRALEVHGPTTPALAMGDFNDEPFDSSLVTHALSTRQRRKVLNADNPLPWNLAWPPMGGRPDQPDGTFY